MLEIIKKISKGSDIVSELEKYCDEVTPHPSGNIIGLIRGTDSGIESIMLATHTDAPHFICTEVNDDGTVSLSPVGSLKRGGTSFTDVVSDKGVRGILMCEGTDNAPVFKADIGDTDGRADFGDKFRIVRPADSLTKETITGFSLSVTVPVSALLECARILHKEKPKCNVYFAFTAEGQYDFKLYGAAARETGADRAVCIGAVDSCDGGVTSGEGAYVRLCDKSFSSDKPLSDALVSVGAKPIVMQKGVCAASRVQVNGTPSAQLDVPVKYLDSVCECLRLADAVSLRDTLVSLCQK